MKPLFSQKFAILTAENPRYGSAKGGNAALEQEMKAKGLKFTPMKGKYGVPENSYLVENPDHQDILSWGKKYGQDSVIVSDGGLHKMVYTNGPHEGLWHESHSISIHDKEPEDFYSTINLNGKPTHFTIDFDMDTKHGESFKKSDSPKHLIHFSTTPGLTTLDPEFQGTAGRHSPETKHGKPTHPRVYFYEEGTPTESVVTGGAKSKYIVKHPGHDKIIDIANDLENQQQAKQQWLQKPIGSMQDAYFKLLKDKGYLGFKNSASGLPNVVALFHATPVHAEISMPKDMAANPDWTKAEIPMSLKKSQASSKHQAFIDAEKQAHAEEMSEFIDKNPDGSPLSAADIKHNNMWKKIYADDHQSNLNYFNKVAQAGQIDKLYDFLTQAEKMPNYEHINLFNKFGKNFHKATIADHNIDTNPFMNKIGTVNPRMWKILHKMKENELPLEELRHSVSASVEKIKGPAKVNEVLSEAKPDMRSKILAALRKEKLAKMNGTGVSGAGGATPPMMAPAVPASPAAMAMSKAEESESHMAKKDLKDIMEYAQALDKMVVESEDLEDWVDSKITVARQYLSDIAHYLSYEHGQPTEELGKSDKEWTKQLHADIDDLMNQGNIEEAASLMHDLFIKPKSHHLNQIVESHPDMATEFFKNYLSPQHIDYIVKNANKPEDVIKQIGKKLKPNHIDYLAEHDPAAVAEHLSHRLNEKQIDAIVNSNVQYGGGLGHYSGKKIAEQYLSKNPIYAAKYKKSSLEKGDVIGMKTKKVISTDTKPASKTLVAKQPTQAVYKRNTELAIDSGWKGDAGKWDGKPDLSLVKSKDLEKGDVVSMKDRKIISTDTKPAPKELVAQQPKAAKNERALAQRVKSNWEGPRPEPVLNEKQLNHLVEKEPDTALKFHADKLNENHLHAILNNKWGLGGELASVIAEKFANDSRLKPSHINSIMRWDSDAALDFLKHRLDSNHAQYLFARYPSEIAEGLYRNPNEKHIDAIVKKEPELAKKYLSDHPIYQSKYGNVQKSLQKPQPSLGLAKSDSKKAKFERCVLAVKKKSGDKVNPWAVCHASVDGAKKSEDLEKADIKVKEQAKPTKGMPQAKQLKADADLEKIKEGAENVAKAADKKKSELSKSEELEKAKAKPLLGTKERKEFDKLVMQVQEKLAPDLGTEERKEFDELVIQAKAKPPLGTKEREHFDKLVEQAKGKDQVAKNAAKELAEIKAQIAEEPTKKINAIKAQIAENAAKKLAADYEYHDNEILRLKTPTEKQKKIIKKIQERRKKAAVGRNYNRQREETFGEWTPSGQKNRELQLKIINDFVKKHFGIGIEQIPQDAVYNAIRAKENQLISNKAQKKKNNQWTLQDEETHQQKAKELKEQRNNYIKGLKAHLDKQGIPVEDVLGKKTKAGHYVNKPSMSNPRNNLQHTGTPDSIIHEIAHLIYHGVLLSPKNKNADGSLPHFQQGFQQQLDNILGEIQKQYGYGQQWRTVHESIPLAIEQKLRRFMGFPAHQKKATSSNPKKQWAIDVPNKQIVHIIKNPKGKTVWLSGKTANIPSDVSENIDKILTGELSYTSKEGFKEGTSIGAKIGGRARAASQDKTRKDADTLMRSDEVLEKKLITGEGKPSKATVKATSEEKKAIMDKLSAALDIVKVDQSEEAQKERKMLLEHVKRKLKRGK